MPFNDASISLTNNPLDKSVYVEQFEEAHIAPGAPQFIATEDLLNITTESGISLITEG